MKTYFDLSKELTESRNKEKEVFHGSNSVFRHIEPKYMLLEKSNAQEGVGIYFGTFETAEGYGKHIMKTTINEKYFVDSYASVGKVLRKNDLVKLCIDMHKVDSEAMFYKISDWIYIENPEDVTKSEIIEFVDNIKDDEVRNFMVDFAMTFGVEDFVKSWNTHFKYIHGTYNKQLNFYSIINTTYKLEVVK